MSGQTDVQQFICQWKSYLRQRGHKVKRDRNKPNLLLSQNHNSVKYRWILFTSQTRTWRITAIEHENIQSQLKLAHRAEQVYAVIKFSQPISKVIVLPADRLIKISRLKSDKGGIIW